MGEKEFNSNIPKHESHPGRQTDYPELVASFTGQVLSVNSLFTQVSHYTAESLTARGGLENLFESLTTYDEIVGSIEKGEAWDGHAIFLDAEQDEFVAQVKASTCNEKDQFALSFFDVTKSKKSAQVETRLLRAISYCTETLFSQTDTAAVLPRVLETIGKAMLADRCYIYSINTESGQPFAERQHEWARKNSLFTKNFAEYKKFNFNSFSEIFPQLEKGEEIALTPRSKVNPGIVKALENLNIHSFLIVPIFKDSTLWGYIGFDDTENLRDWNRAEKKALKSLAHNIGAFLKINHLTQELLTKNRQLEYAIEGATDGLWVCDELNSSLYISPKMHEIFGYQQGEWNKSIQQIVQLLKTEDTETLEQNIKEAVAKKLPSYEFETITKHKKGRYIWIKGSVGFVYGSNGQVIKHSGSISDVTTEKSYELKIRKQEEHYQRLVNSLKEVVFETDKEGNITFLNNSWKNLTRHNLRNSVGKKLWHFTVPAHAALLENKIAQLKEKIALPGKTELQFVQANKEPLWTEVWLRGLYDSNYELTGVSGSIFDINTEKIASQQLRESEERYRLISENTKDIVCLHDETGRFTYISPSIEEILGQKPKALIGREPWDCIHAEDKARLRQLFAAVLKGNDVGYVRYRVKHRKGHYVWVETVANLQIHATETGGRFVQTATRDISQQKQAEEEIKNALEKERQLIELRTNLINMISHEFRTPLTTIKSSSELLLKYLPSLKKSDIKDRFSLHFERIKGQVNRINELISGVLLLGRMDSGKIHFQPEPIDFVEFLHEFLLEYSNAHTEDKRPVNLNIKGKPGVINIDPLLVSHILRNLISNALKYSAGKKNPELTITFEKSATIIEVIDYGIGITEADRKNLFQSFFRGGNALTIPGTGLGLVIVKQFVEMHGGTIDLESKIDEGTTIKVKLPK